MGRFACLYQLFLEGTDRYDKFVDTAFVQQSELTFIFFEDRSGHILNDELLSRLISMPNVIVTSHQAFLTEDEPSTDGSLRQALPFAFRVRN